ncbi:hypothetical protein E2320_013248 [Naja naja]|nr:hypothetical protein E2320_013248 [Naja naja]
MGSSDQQAQQVLCKEALLGPHSLPPSAYATVKAYGNFDADRDALTLETAIKAKGYRFCLPAENKEGTKAGTPAPRIPLGKELSAALKSALSGHLETVILGLLKTPAQYDASELKAAMKGLGTDEDTLIEIICSRTNQELANINRVYRESKLAELLGRRNEDCSVVDFELIDQDARVNKYSLLLFERYKSYSPYDMLESIKKEVKGDLENAFLNLAGGGFNSQGKGTRDKVLIRIMVSRAEVDMLKVKSEFKRKYGKSLYYFIQVGEQEDGAGLGLSN